MRFTQALKKTSIEYGELVWAKALRCARVEDEYVVKGKIIEGVKD